MSPEKRKGGSIHTQYYTMRKRIKDASFNSPNLSLFDKCNNHDDSRHGHNFQDRVTFNHEARVGVSTFDDCFANDMGFEETINSVTSTSVVDKSPTIQFHEESKDSSFHSFHLNDGRITCTFNTEDPEIPCNDDVFLMIHDSTSLFYSVRHQIATDYIDPSSSEDENNHEQGLSAVVDPEPSFTWLQMASTNLSSEFDSAQPHVGYVFKSESFDTKCVHPLSQQPDLIRNPGQSPSIHTNSVLNGDRALTEDGQQGLDSSAAYSEMPLQTESMDSSSISDCNNSDNDGHLPDFSDIEALILRMDLEYAQESCITSEVARHQYNHYERTVIRLEQTDLSSLQRSMSSLGVFAIFHSRHFNYYIKKTEVTIGRSTDDTDVDIDLRKEGYYKDGN